MRKLILIQQFSNTFFSGIGHFKEINMLKSKSKKENLTLQFPIQTQTIPGQLITKPRFRENACATLANFGEWERRTPISLLEHRSLKKSPIPVTHKIVKHSNKPSAN